MTATTRPVQQPDMTERRARRRLRSLVGSGDRIGAFALPFVVIGAALNIAFPDAFSVGGPPEWLQIVSWVGLAAGVVLWAWSVALRVVVGIALYVGSRLFAPDEEVELGVRFGPAWDAYCEQVRIRWL